MAPEATGTHRPHCCFFKQSMGLLFQTPYTPGWLPLGVGYFVASVITGTIISSKLTPPC
jgi:hypothetical protein